MKKNYLKIDMKTCRICLNHKSFLYPLFDYVDVPTKGEMLSNCANVKVFHGDGLPDKICCTCTRTLMSAYKLKKTAEKSDSFLQKTFNTLNIGTAKENTTKKMSFDSITDIKSKLDDLSSKHKPKFEIGIEVLAQPMASNHPNAEALNGKDIVICDTVIRKIEPHGTVELDDIKQENEMEAEFLEDDFFQDDPRDEDYIPSIDDEDSQIDEKSESARKPKMNKFQISTLEDVRAYEENLKRTRENKRGQIQQTSSYIKYYPLLKNGKKGPPILLRKPREEVKPGGPYPPLARDRSLPKGVLLRKEKVEPHGSHQPLRRKERPISKPREKDCCPVCGLLTFGLTTHMLRHAEKKPFSCEHCPRSFVTKSCYKAHVKLHTGIKDIICDICGLGFYSKKNVIRHLLTHNGERPFACTKCPKTFTLNHVLQRHLQSHAGYKPYECTECSMLFRQKSQLQTHMIIHTGARPYSCKKQALKRHLEIHAGYKPHKCTECLMSFNGSHHLRNHMLIHTGDRPYSCKICEVAYAYKVNLNNHVTRVHGINLRYKSIYTFTEELLERESKAMTQAQIQANALLDMALQLQPQPVPEDHISTQIVYDASE